MSPEIGDLIIRNIRIDDYDAIIALTAREFKPASIDARIETAIGGAAWIDVKAAALRSEIDQNPSGCFAAVGNAKIAGYLTTGINLAAGRGAIINLTVSSEFQGQGIGRKLLARALDYFRALGLQQAKIETLADNAAGQHLYPALGFREVARQVHYVLPLK